MLKFDYFINSLNDKLKLTISIDLNWITIPNEHLLKWTQSCMDIIPNGIVHNGHDPKWTPSRMDTIPNGHDLEWTRSRMNTIPNGLMDIVPNEHLYLYYHLDVL